MVKKVEVRVPASIGNIGSGFDCFGVSIRLYNRYTIERYEKFEILSSIKGIPKGKDNLVYKGFKKGLEYLGKEEFPVRIKIDGKIPKERGLGSSGTAILAGVISSFCFFSLPVKKKEVLKIALKLEKHIDNLASSLFGGFVLSGVIGDNIYVLKLPFFKGIRIVVFIPEMVCPTDKARKIIPKKIPLKDAVFNLFTFGCLCSGIFLKNEEFLKIGTLDKIHQKYRASIFKYLDPLIEIGIKNGAKGGFLSGAGPSVGFFVKKEEAERLKEIIQIGAEKLNIKGKTEIFVPGGKAVWKIWG